MFSILPTHAGGQGEREIACDSHGEREGHRAIVLKPTMKAKVSETESSTHPTPQKSHGHPYVGQGASLRKENKGSKLKEQRLADCSC